MATYDIQDRPQSYQSFGYGYTANQEVRSFFEFAWLARSLFMSREDEPRKIQPHPWKRVEIEPLDPDDDEDGDPDAECERTSDED